MALSSKYCKKRRVVTLSLDSGVLKRTLRKATRTTSKRLVVYQASDDLALNLSKIKDDLPNDFLQLTKETQWKLS